MTEQIKVGDPEANDSNFGGIVTAIGFDECVEFLARVVPKSTEIDPDIAGEMIAAALTLGGYIGAELCCEGVEPPHEERRDFARKFGKSSDAIGRIKAHAAATIQAAITKPKIIAPS